MAKILLLLALALVVYGVVRGWQRKVGGPGANQTGANPTRAPRDNKNVPEDMVRCTVCGVHLPRSESFTSRGKFFCTDEHRRLGA